MWAVLYINENRLNHYLANCYRYTIAQNNYVLHQSDSFESIVSYLAERRGKVVITHTVTIRNHGKKTD